ncbi:MAG: UDP-3-O-[3-hydroxymyristoyl] N-acetylglucosamine deacetylase [Acidobacteria bacterium]|nr:MAG: UDP-3-O-[3-hydroxymyristoyl] N-acetylglucosamine deacetylase [Acidobacteriota bacterium]
MEFQKSIKRSVSCTGIGLHSGKPVKLRMLPAGEDTGVIFRRVDLGNLEIRASQEVITQVNYATSISNGKMQIFTVEHLLGALYGLGINNIIVELDTDEVPILDGSAAPYVELLQQAEIVRLERPNYFLQILEPIEAKEGDRSITVYPSDHFDITYMISFNHPWLRRQEKTIRFSRDHFIKQIAPARTFGFLHEIAQMRASHLALGGSLENAIVLTEHGILNEHLRFPDEFVRHKILDLIGDLALLSYRLLGHVVAHKAGHRLHSELVTKILEHSEKWDLVLWKNKVRHFPKFPIPVPATAI